MDKNALWKWLILFGLLAFSMVLVVPPLDKVDANGQVVHAGKIKLGLDLKGGTSFTVQIDKKQVEEEIKARNPDWNETQVATEVEKTLNGAQARVLEVLRNRIDNLGIAEPIIYPGRDNRIIIQLPGIDEKQRKQAEESIRSAAFLEFRMVHEDSQELVDKVFEKNLSPEGYKPTSVGNQQYFKRDPAFPEKNMDLAFRERLGRFQAPSGFEFLLEKSVEDGQTVYRPHFVNRRRELTGDFLKDASVDYKGMNEPIVKLSFDAKGAKKFWQVTEDYAPGGKRNPDPNKYRQLAIVLDGRLYSAPRINEPIPGGRAEISGRFTITEAQFLANILRAGSLPAPVEIIEKRSVAPSLGADSIRSGVRASLLGGLGVLLFMGFYYLASGVIANIALLLNGLILPLGMVATAGFMGVFLRESSGASAVTLPVLTLPGIAGIVLSMGMAVDANVLIFERIREERAAGKSLWSAVVAGYDRAFITILDSNLTTLISGVIMFVFGSGPIRGYAITLCAGIIVSMFTAIVVTKLIFSLIINKGWVKDLKMLTMIKAGTSIDFLGKRTIAIAISVIVIVVSWGALFVKTAKNPSSTLGVDFVGGTSMTFATKEALGEDAVRKVLEGASLRVSNIQQQKDEIGGKEYLSINTSLDKVNGKKPAEVASEVLAKEFPKAEVKLLQDEEVGPQVGKELKVSAIWALGLSLIGMIIYITWRFEFGFALGAIVALIHDVLVTAGVFVLLGNQLTMQTVAVLLTIIGYSINDTIVIFDRIREDIRVVRNKSFTEICNISVNQTLARTILTTLTVFITVIMLLVFGGGALKDFALALFIGLIAGTYSTVFIATPVVLAWHKGKTPDLGKTPTAQK